MAPMIVPARFAVPGALAAALLLPATAHADAISGPPACPPGTRGQSWHSGQWCAPATCTDDAACGPSATCRPWRVCTRDSDVEPGGLRPHPAPPVRMQLVVGTCDPASKCRGDEEPPPPLVGKLLEGPPQCRDDRHCVASDLPALPPRTADVPPAPTTPTSPPAPGSPPVAPRPGCGCTTDGTPALPALLALLLIRRRRP